MLHPDQREILQRRGGLLFLFFLSCPMNRKGIKERERTGIWQGQGLVTWSPFFFFFKQIYWAGDLLLTWWFAFSSRWPQGNFWTGNPVEASCAEVSYTSVAIAHAVKLLVWWGVCGLEECWDKAWQCLLLTFCFSSSLPLCCKNSVQQSPESTPSLLMPFWSKNKIVNSGNSRLAYKWCLLEISR